MPNGGAGAHKRADYSGVAGRQTRRRPGPLPSRWPRLIPSRIAPEILLRDSGPSPQQRAYGVSRPVRVYRQVPCRLKDCGITVLGTHSAVRLIGRCCGRKVGKEEKKKVQRRREVRVAIPGAANGPGVGRGSFCRLLPAYGQEQAVYFVRLAPPQDANHTVCALINHING